MNLDRDRSQTGIALAAAWALFVSFAAPRAVATALEDEALSIEAVSALGAATLHVTAAEMNWDAAGRRLFWSTTSRALVDAQSGATIATLTLASLSLRQCSRVDLSLAVDAGAADAVITVRTGRLSFDTIAAADATARATASVSISDRNSNGAVLAGVGAPGTPVYRARVNGGPDHGALFSGLVGALQAGAGGNASAYQADPQTGFRAVGAPVSDVAVELVFSLSAGDRGSASTVFDVDPNPAACADDRDADGRPDWLDGCPDDAAKSQPGECGCGYADIDADADGVLDCDDNCPELPNADQSDADGDGEGDSCDATPHGDAPGGGDDDTGDASDDDSDGEREPTGGDMPRDDNAGDTPGHDADADDDPNTPRDDNAGDDHHADDPPADTGEPRPTDADANGAWPEDRTGTMDDEHDDRVAFVPLAFSPCGLGSAYLIPLAVVGLATAPMRRLRGARK
ncbi:MAG: hypothetical protein AB7Q17_00640 [Phycisphaerae bacterium]